MRWLAVLLLAANAVYFGWRYDQRLREAAAIPPPVAPLPATTPSLRLISELDELPPPRESENPAPASEIASNAASAPPPEIVPISATEAPPMPVTNRPVASTGAPSGVCVEIGPFASSPEADSFEAWITTRAAALHRVSQTVRKRQFFGIYLEARNNAEAQANVVDLERKGVRDVLLIQRIDMKNAISLGMFSSQDAVNRRLAEMTKQGYQPVVVPSIVNTDLYWLRANLAVGYADPESVPPAQLAGAAVKVIDCTQIADPSPSS